MPTPSAQLLPGRVIYHQSSALNEFEAMPVGPCTTLIGYLLTGDAAFFFAFFIQR